MLNIADIIAKKGNKGVVNEGLILMGPQWFRL